MSFEVKTYKPARPVKKFRPQGGKPPPFPIAKTHRFGDAAARTTERKSAESPNVITVSRLDLSTRRPINGDKRPASSPT